jgi:PAS domain S-box-containing protein
LPKFPRPFLEAIVESSPTAMVMTDRAGRIVQSNREAEKLFGFQRDELAGQMVEMLIPERFRRGISPTASAIS